LACRTHRLQNHAASRLLPASLDGPMNTRHVERVKPCSIVLGSEEISIAVLRKYLEPRSDSSCSTSRGFGGRCSVPNWSPILGGAILDLWSAGIGIDENGGIGSCWTGRHVLRERARHRAEHAHARKREDERAQSLHGGAAGRGGGGGGVPSNTPKSGVGA